MQQDLNNLAVFAAVVECGSFTAAADHLGIGKSQVSQRLARLEARLGMRLIQRTTRQQQVTDFGHDYYPHCRAMLDAAERAQALADQVTTTPSGMVRVACPSLFSELILGPIAVRFMQAYPDVHLLVEQSNREIDLVGEGFDVVFRVRRHMDDSTMVARSVGNDQLLLVASPELLRGQRLAKPEDLHKLPSLSMVEEHLHGRHQWELVGPKGVRRTWRHQPRLESDDLLMLRSAAMAGHGLVALPGFLCARAIESKQLMVVLPRWKLPPLEVYALYPSRQGQPPAVREFLNFVGPRIGQWLDEVHGSIRSID